MFVRFRRVDTLVFQSLEHEVPHQVGCCERGSACVQGLEDLLGVLRSMKLDRDQLQTVEEDTRQFLCSDRMFIGAR